MPVRSATYQQFLEQVSGSPSLDVMDGRELILQRFQLPQKTIARFAPVTFLLDYSTRKYVYVEETCYDLLGYTASYFLETGLDEYLLKWHPYDFKLINEKVFPDNFLFLETISPEEYSHYIFSHNYRVRNATGAYTNIIQRYSFIYNRAAGKPTGLIGIVFDITHFKNDQSIVHTIEKCSIENGHAVLKLVKKHIHPVFDDPAPLLISKREQEILKLMSQGLSSKHIAGILRLSVNTVNNHRKNMLAKTNCNNAGELMRYAMQHGIL